MRLACFAVVVVLALVAVQGAAQGDEITVGPRT